MFDFAYYRSMEADQSYRQINGIEIAWKTVAHTNDAGVLVNTDERYGDEYEVTVDDYAAEPGDDFATWFKAYDDTIRQYWEQAPVFDSPAGPVNIYMRAGDKSKALYLATKCDLVDGRKNPSISLLFRTMLDEALAKEAE